MTCRFQWTRWNKMSFRILRSIYCNKNFNSNERLVLSMGLSFLALVLLANFTKGQSNTLNDRFVFPMYSEGSEDSDIVIEFDTMSFSRKALHVTMTTNYNETYINDIDEMPYVMPLKQYLGFNASKVFTFSVNDTVESQIRHVYGDILQLFNTDSLGTTYIVFAEKNFFINIYATEAVSQVTLAAANSSLNNTYMLNYGDIVSFTPSAPGVFLIEGTQKVGVIYSNKDFTRSDGRNATEDIIWEMVPAVAKAGREYMFYIPAVESAYLEVLGSQDGQLTLYKSEGVTSLEIKAFERKVINVNETRYVYLISSTPVTVMCVVKFTLGSKIPATNMFNVFPVEQNIGCSYFRSFNCANTSCAYVITKNTTKSVKLLDKNGVVLRSFNSSNQQVKSVLSAWEINGISDGIHILQSENISEPLTVFYIDLNHGRYYQIRVIDKTICDSFFTMRSTHGQYYTLAVNITSVPNNSFSETTRNLTDVTTVTIIVNGTIPASVNITLPNMTAQSLPKMGFLSYITSNITNETQTSIVGQSTNNRLLFRFMYEEIPDDDENELNEYLIAVIVSLCTAIFAVIAVISTFLLLELLRRRRQIRNTKIRPFVT